MADAAVEFLLENLKDLLSHRYHLISGVENQIEKLQRDLRLFQVFLKVSTKKRRRDPVVQESVRQILSVVYDSDDVVDAFVIESAHSRFKSYFSRVFNTPQKLLSIARKAEAVAADVQRVYDLIRPTTINLGNGDGRSPREHEAPLVRQDNVVGFEDEAETIIGYLLEETENLDVISITGMPGLGKTTLAGKIFRDPDIEYEFHTRIWVYVSQEFTKKNVFLDILRQLITLTDDVYHKSDQEIAQLINDHLKTEKFLIVMDDVWTASDWDKLEIALPKSNKIGKVLITSRHEEVARYANRSRGPHMLRFLNETESWLLLQLEVFRKAECHRELESLGRKIAKDCRGLPLAIVVIGGILATKISTLDQMKIAWERVSKSVSTFLNEEDQEKRMENIIALSYDKLPYHLRPCFLYFGMFPGDFEIPVWKLIRMWIAEGFIQQKPEFSMEETAEIYLEYLMKGNLVRIHKMGSDGRVKTCRIHDMLRDFCKTEAGRERENFLQEMKTSDDGGFVPPVSSIKEFRRLCIHSNVLNFLSSKPYGPRVRSFVCFSKDDILLPRDKNSAIIAAFTLLRVVEVEALKFTKIPCDLHELLHLRYIALSFSSAVLPSFFAKLFNIQTLVVDTLSPTLEIRADISKMIQLRHLKTNVATTLPQTQKSSKEKLQTLGLMSPDSCTKKVLDGAPNLKKLGIRGKLALLLDGTSRSFDLLRRLDKLVKLKLVNDVFPDPASEGKLLSLPKHDEFPPSLRSLTLSDTLLDWIHMSVLGLLKELKVLKLKDRAFVGECWETAGGGFSHLQVLQIGCTDLVTWSASHHHFPRLRRLELNNCEELEDIPIGLAGIESFEVLSLHRTNNAVASAKRILEAKNVQPGFKLSIFPPDESSS